MKKIIRISVLVCFIISLTIGLFGYSENVSAKTMKKRGTYTNTEKKIKVKFSSNKIMIKGKMMYGKKLKIFQKKYKNIGKGKKTFKINSNTKYYVSNPAGYERLSLKEAKSRMKTISHYPGVAYFYIFVKNKRAYKIIFTVC